ncbi:MAG: neutral/alkaline non-lysosomal ceramidase N-terminal domain-containing protein [Polyangiales bacterium]
MARASRVGLWAGAATCEIAVPQTDLCLMGWGVPTNVGRSKGTALCARALVLGTLGSIAFVYVCLDLCFISTEVRERVFVALQRRGLACASERLLLTATHTHSSLGGYTRDVFYASSGPGFSEANTTAIVEAVAGSVHAAHGRLRAASAYVHQGPLAAPSPVAFNRSLAAYNRNHDVRPLGASERHEAVPDHLTVLRVDARETGTPMAIVSWFGLHGTCVHADQNVFHADHPGATADHVEREASRRGWADVVAIASQSVCGDVTPNHRFDAARRCRVGASEDDFAAAKRIGRLVGARVLELAEVAREDGVELSGNVQCSLTWIDPVGAPVSPEFAYGRRDATTDPPTLGLAFAFGTAEGPGPARPARWLQQRFRRVVGALPRHFGVGRRWSKLPLWSFGPRAPAKILGFLPAHERFLTHVPNRFLRYIGREVHEHGLDTPWVPRLLPSQLIRVGTLVLCAVPFEPTTHAGTRLQRTVRAHARDTTHIVVCGYANDYASYLCTDEEYLEQAYEGASTLFGRWTLGAWQTVVKRQTVSMLAARDSPAPLREQMSGRVQLRAPSSAQLDAALARRHASR